MAAATSVSTLISFLVLLFLVAPRPSSSRPINGFLSAGAGNIALPGDRGFAQQAPGRGSPLDVSATPKPEMITSDDKYREDRDTVPPPAPPAPTTTLTKQQQQLLAVKYSPLLLNFLPRGRVPPSGPSPGINGNKT